MSRRKPSPLKRPMANLRELRLREPIGTYSDRRARRRALSEGREALNAVRDDLAAIEGTRRAESTAPPTIAVAHEHYEEPRLRKARNSCRAGRLRQSPAQLDRQCRQIVAAWRRTPPMPPTSPKDLQIPIPPCSSRRAAGGRHPRHPIAANVNALAPPRCCDPAADELCNRWRDISSVRWERRISGCRGHSSPRGVAPVHLQGLLTSRLDSIWASRRRSPTTKLRTRAQRPQRMAWVEGPGAGERGYRVRRPRTSG